MGISGLFACPGDSFGNHSQGRQEACHCRPCRLVRASATCLPPAVCSWLPSILIGLLQDVALQDGGSGGVQGPNGLPGVWVAPGVPLRLLLPPRGNLRHRLLLPVLLLHRRLGLPPDGQDPGPGQVVAPPPCQTLHGGAPQLRQGLRPVHHRSSERGEDRLAAEPAEQVGPIPCTGPATQRPTHSCPATCPGWPPCTG